MRTSSEVQNGNSTKIISRLERLSGSVARRCATGKPRISVSPVITRLNTSVRVNSVR